MSGGESGLSAIAETRVARPAATSGAGTSTPAANSSKISFIDRERRQNGKTPNAFKHGVFAAPAILPGESREEFEELLSRLAEEWIPDGATEVEAVLSIAKAMWLKGRWEQFVEIQMFKNSFDPNHGSYSETLGFSSFANYMRLEARVGF